MLFEYKDGFKESEAKNEIITGSDSNVIAANILKTLLFFRFSRYQNTRLSFITLQTSAFTIL